MSGTGDVKQVEGDVPMDTEENSTQREVGFHFRDFVIWIILDKLVIVVTFLIVKLLHAFLYIANCLV